MTLQYGRRPRGTDVLDRRSLLCHIANALVAFRDEMRMDFDLSDVQRKRYDEVLAGVRAQRSAVPGGAGRPPFSRVEWSAAAAFGLVGLCLPPEYGGGGLGALDTALCLEAFTEGGADAAASLWDARSHARLHHLRPDRLYERMDVTGLTGVTAAQRNALLALGAVDHGDPATGV